MMMFFRKQPVIPKNNNFIKYQNMCKEITFKLIKYKKNDYSTFDKYYKLYHEFINEIIQIQTKYDEFNRTVIRKNHIKNPIMKGNMSYIEEIISESWYNLIHIPNTQSILTNLIDNNIDINCFYQIEKDIISLFNQNLNCINIYNNLKMIFKNKNPYSIINKNIINNNNSMLIVQLFWENSIEYNYFNDIIKNCLIDNNYLMIKSYQEFIHEYEIKDLHEKCKDGYNDFLKIKYNNLLSLTDIINMYNELKLYNSPFEIKIINNFIKKKLYNHESELANKVSNEDIKYYELIPFLNNQELFISELIKFIKEKAVISEIMDFKKVPEIFEKEYDKLKLNFNNNSEVHNKLFVFNDTFVYKISNYIIPDEILNIQNSYESHYKAKYPQRKLKWIYDKSFITYTYLDYEINSNFITFLILNLFNTNNFLTKDLIVNLTNIPINEINNLLTYLENKSVILINNNIIKLNIMNNSNKKLILNSDNKNYKSNEIEYLVSLQDKIKLELIKSIKNNSKIALNELFTKYQNTDINPILKALENQDYIEIKDEYAVYLP